MKMKRDIRDRWLEALRSGKYQQTVGTLMEDGAYCCLGVLADVVKGEVPQDRFDVQKGYGMCIYSEKEGASCTADLPDEFRRWLGLDKRLKDRLIKMNDGDGEGGDASNFHDIADYIEQKVPVTD